MSYFSRIYLLSLHITKTNIYNEKYIHCKTHAHIPSHPHQVTTITVDMPTFSNNSESKIRLFQK